MPAGVRVPRGCSVVPTGLGRCGDVPGAEETVSQPPFRTSDACSSTTFYPRLGPWVALLRRFAARIVTRGPLFVQSGSCDTVSEAPGYWQMSPRDTRKSELAFIARSLTSMAQPTSRLPVNLKQ